MPRYFLAVRFPLGILWEDDVSSDTVPLDDYPPGTYEKEPFVFHETDSESVAGGLLGLFRKAEPPVGRGLELLAESPLVLEVVGTADMDLTESVLLREKLRGQINDIKQVASKSKDDWDPVGLADAGLPHDRRTVILVLYSERAQKWEPLVREELGSDDTARVNSPARSRDAERNRGKSPDPRPVRPIATALDGLLHALEMHRLAFLFCTWPSRGNSGCTGGTETLYKDELPQNRIRGDATESDDEDAFLLRHSHVLEQFAQDAIGRFGPGKGCKPQHKSPDGSWVDDEDGSYPHWTLDELGCRLMEDSSNRLMGACGEVLAADASGEIKGMVDRVVSVAHDGDQPRWYSAVIVRWEYLSNVDGTIAELKKAQVAARGCSTEDAGGSQSAGAAPQQTEAAGGGPGGASSTTRTGALSESERKKVMNEGGLATAVVAALGLRELYLMGHYYPKSVDAQEAASLEKELSDRLALILNGKGFELVKKSFLAEGETANSSPDAKYGLMATVLIGWHHAFPKDHSTEKIIEENVKALIAKCQEEAAASVLKITARIQEIETTDCRIPHPADDATFQEPRRFLQLLREYWGLGRQVVLDVANVGCAFQPHPLLPLMMNLRLRLDACFERLSSVEGASEAEGAANTLLDTALGGDFDDLSAVPEYTNGEIAKVDAFIARTHLKLGSKTYDLTRAEQVFIQLARNCISQHREELKRAWAGMQRAADQQGRRLRSAQAAHPPDSAGGSSRPHAAAAGAGPSAGPEHENVEKMPTSPKCDHSADFTSVIWYGTMYTFTKMQAACVRVLWAEWEKGGLTLSEKTIGEAVESDNDRFRLLHVFRTKSRNTGKRTKKGQAAMHPAWRTMIVPAGKGIFKLAPPQS